MPYARIGAGETAFQDGITGCGDECGGDTPTPHLRSRDDLDEFRFPLCKRPKVTRAVPVPEPIKTHSSYTIVGPATISIRTGTAISDLVPY